MLWSNESLVPELAGNSDARRILAAKNGVWTNMDDRMIHLYAGLPDISGRHRIILRTDVPRDITSQGRDALYFLTLSTTAQAALTVVLLLFIMQRLVVRPLDLVKRHVVSVGRRCSGDLAKLGMRRNDEIGTLAAEFDQMMQRLADSRRQILQAKDAAETATARATAAREEAVKAAKVKSEFLARMSHEIRTPLGGVMGMVGLLEKTKLDACQRHYTELAYQAARGLLAIINDILDFSKIEAGKVELESIPFDLHKIVHDIIELLGPEAAKKKVELSQSLSERVPRYVTGDPGRIQQVLTNLISNALKFTCAGSVRISVAFTEAVVGAEICPLCFEVKDTGIGIPGDRRDRLFKSFSQVETSTTRRFGGTGLGLAICKRLVESMGGEIGVNSREGAGSTFWFTLNLRAAEPIAADPLPAAAADKRLAGLHLLVAEDNEMNQLIVSEMLKRLGCTCEVAANGALALRALERGRFDAVIMDCQMPEMDGLEATRRIRAREAAEMCGGRMPIIALTADALSGDRERCFAAGMDQYVSKPIGERELFTALESVALSRKAA